MKKIISIMFIVFNVFIYGKELINIKSFKSFVEEETFIEKNVKIKKYNLIVEFPDKLYKEVIYPEINKGEKYIYNNNVKKTYYPLLEQYIEEPIEEDNILDYINFIKNDFDIEENINIKVEYDNGYSILIRDVEEIGGIKFPKLIEIYEKNIIIKKIRFFDIEIDKNIDENLFE
ncbi:hypothetical protein EV215_1491 [Hypnocyclicus thermotrophus]|uniref:Uncharacterized protein n=1 Tax=Hypnocyclicus thermotrophus TaxID=1627895 RepID=A0AA46DXV6_9FUSO|nr:hypothetical protein [Hypnocyclicus thermotrophus]TDT69149.1 hypothetical protein EV215_1491 [Hypnocyclicus thermotrophus]